MVPMHAQKRKETFHNHHHEVERCTFALLTYGNHLIFIYPKEMCLTHPADSKVSWISLAENNQARAKGSRLSLSVRIFINQQFNKEAQ